MRTDKLHLSLIGNFKAVVGARELPIELRSSRQILAWLVFKGDHCETRERLASVIWPDKGEGRARGSLRQALFHIRKCADAVDFEGVITDRNTVRLQRGSVTTDIDGLLDQIERQHCISPRLLESPTISESLLGEFLGVSDLYSDWITLKRMDLQLRICHALNSIVESGQNVELRIQAAYALLAQDSADEAACRALMSLCAECGRVAEALRVYSRLGNSLREELDVLPSVQTRDLARQIRLKSSDAPEAQTRPDTNRTSSRALRPCIEIEGFETTELQSPLRSILNAFRAELMSRLSKFREWRVLDSAISKSRQFETQYRLSASAVQIGESLQITLHLLSARSGELVWSETFRDITAQWTQILVEVASQVSATANISISHQRLQELGGQESATVKGFDAWLLSQQLLFTVNRENWEKAQAVLEQLIDDEPGFTRAYTGLARIYNTRHLAFAGREPEKRSFVESLRLSNAAISSDPLDCQAHLCRAWSLTMQGNFQEGSLSFETARNLNPYDPWTILSTALGAAFCGRIDLAQQLAARSLAMGWTTEPVHWGYHATIRFLCGDYLACVQACEQAGGVFYNIPAWHAAALVQLDRYPEAAGQIEQLIGRCTENWTGAASPAPKQILDWIAGAFPFKLPEARRLFVDSVDAAYEFRQGLCAAHMH